MCDTRKAISLNCLPVCESVCGHPCVFLCVCVCCPVAQVTEGHVLSDRLKPYITPHSSQQVNKHRDLGQKQGGTGSTAEPDAEG